MAQYVGPWEWGPLSFWPECECYHPPLVATDALDLRTLDQQSTPGDVANEGNGLFTVPDPLELDARYYRLPDTLDAVDRMVIADRLGLDAIAAPTREALIVDLVTRHADPMGQTFARPVMPGRDGWIRFAYGGATLEVRVDPFDPAWANVLDVIHATYRTIRHETLIGLHDHDRVFHRRYLSVLAEQFGTTEVSRFIPRDLPREDPIPHGTMIAESFNKPDASPLGPDLVWTKYDTNAVSVDNAVFAVFNNQCRSLATGAHIGSARADVDLAGPDLTAQIMVTNFGGPSDNDQAGACSRYAVGSQTHYVMRAIRSLNAIYFDKVVAGVLTNLAGPVGSIAISIPQAIGITSNGSSHVATWAGVAVGAPQIDTALTTGTRAGLFGFASTPVDMDDFTAFDLAASPTVTRRPPRSATQAINRAATY